MGILDKNFDVVTGFHLFIDSPAGGGSTTITTAVAAAVTSFTLTSPTLFAIGDDVRLGSGETAELVRIQGLAGAVVTTAKPLMFDHPALDVCVEQSALNLGVPEADGCKFNLSVESTDVFSAIQKLAYGTLIGYGDLTVSWRFMTITADVMALALGLPRAAVVGDGTAAAQTGTVGPRLFTTDGVTMGGLLNCAAVITGTLNDGTALKVTFNGLSFNPTTFTTTFSRGQLAAVPVQALATSAAFDFTNTAFLPANVVSTFASSKADLFSEIVGVAQLTDSGTATTTTAGMSAGAFVIPVTSATGIVAGDYVRLGTGDAAEYHLVHSVVSLNLNLRTQVLRAQASGVALVKQTVRDVGGIDGGFTISTPGQVSVQRSETSRLSLKNKVGNIATQMAFNATNVTPENLQMAFGLPSSAFAANVMNFTGRTVGAALSGTLLFRGLTQGGRSISIVGWNGTCQPNGELTMTQAANLLVPIAYKPAVLQAWVNA